ncbi:MAG: hypothetical protein L6R40_008451 [Gallowayella cf. fulva]|nr:MAG: hypothetical protein L6R40_008451 [Xanthomendoza cf. fulva]
MDEPLSTAAPNDLKDPRERLAVQEDHDADLQLDDLDKETLAHTDPSESSTNTETSPDNGDLETDVEKAEKHSLPALTDDKQQQLPDPNIVDWDGPDDPEKPTNWSNRRKYAIVAVISSITFLTYIHPLCPNGFKQPLASSMFAPGIPEVMTEFKSDNVELASFVLSVYILGFAFGPMVLAPMSEEYGRTIVYHVCNILFVVFTIACAVSSNLNMLIAWRFFEGLFGSAPLTIGGGTIADIIVQEKRGGIMAIWAMGPLMGPVIGPVAGGFLSQAKGWRWVFWLITIVAGTITVSAFIFLSETYPPILLERKAKRLRTETGNPNLRSKLGSDLSPRDRFKLAIVRPFKLLLFSPIVLALSTFMAVVYAYLYLLFTTITEVFESTYHFSSGAVGLTYLGIGIGSFIGLLVFGAASDRIVQYKSKNGEMKPEYRLPPMIPGAWVIPIGLFIYGWTAEKKVHWIAPIIGTGFVGLGLLATFMPVSTYLVDAFTLHAASALAANTILRSLLGALLPLAGRSMYQTLGLGWGNSLLAFIAVALCPIPIVFYRYGERIRKHPRFQVKL